MSAGVVLSFIDMQNQIEIDLSVNRRLEVKNSELIKSYAEYDERFLKLALIVKVWNK